MDNPTAPLLTWNRLWRRFLIHALIAIEGISNALGLWKYPLAAVIVFTFAFYWQYTQPTYRLYQKGFGPYDEILTSEQCSTAAAYWNKKAYPTRYTFYCKYSGRAWNIPPI